MIYNRDAMKIASLFFLFYTNTQLIVAYSLRMPIIPTFLWIYKKKIKNILDLALLVWINLLYLRRLKLI